jgi:hypothetical protein
MRWISAAVLATALAFVACSGDSFSTSNQSDASGGSAGAGASGTGGNGTGGANGSSGSGTGGASGSNAGGTSGTATGGANGSLGSGSGGSSGTCTPLPGCTSLTLCNDGCNTCSCANGQWVCTERACPPEDAGRTDAGQGACETDQDCIFRAGSGCCGMCLAKDDPVPPLIPCGAACSIVPPACVCINHRCGTGATPVGESCDRAHNLCAPGLLCCSQCGGPILPDAQNCAPSACTQPVFYQGTPGCPPPAP